MKRERKNRSGFAILEILFGISIFVLVALALSLFARNIWIYGSAISTGLGDTDEVRTLLKKMVAEIRTAAPAETGAYLINSAVSSGFTFYSDIDDDGITERIRYFTESTNLKKGVLEPSGSPLSYNPANEAVTTALTGVTSPSIFAYYDTNYDGTSAPLPEPISLPSVRLVKITITVDKDPNRPPTAKTFSTQVSIRNLKDNL